MTDFADELETHLKRFRAAPFLFVGAGVSRRYLDLDDWAGLLRRMCDFVDDDFDFYFASADGDFPAIASAIAADLHKSWWRERRFAESRKLYEGKVRGSESGLKAEVSRYLADSLDDLPTSGPLAEELDLFREVVIDGVVTTNFDPLLESVFPAFRVFVGQGELLSQPSQGVGEIYKIHGSHEAPDSLVLTRKDYDAYEDRNRVLAAKLTTIFVEHPVVFLGYRLGDENIGSILEEIVSCLDTKEQIDELASRLIFVDWDPKIASATMGRTVLPMAGGRRLPAMLVTVPDYLEIFEVLGELRRGFPAKVLRQLKEQVYELVLDDDPKGRLHVMALDENTDPRQVEIVFGVGAIGHIKAAVGLSRDDLIEDVIRKDGGFPTAEVIEGTLPNCLSRGGNVPVYKYLREAKLLDDGGALLDPKSVPDHVRRHVGNRALRLAPTASQKKAAAKAARDHGTLKALVKAEEPQKALHHIPALDEDNLDPEELRRFLLKHEDLRETNYESQWVKMVCLYDWLRHGRQIKPKGKRVRPRPRPTKKSPGK